MILKLLSFDGLKDILKFVNTNDIPKEDIQNIFREGAGYKFLYWTKKVASK